MCMQIRTCHPLAICYNDQSPLENHHLAAAVRTTMLPEYRYIPVGVLSSYDVYTIASQTNHFGEYLSTFLCMLVATKQGNTLPLHVPEPHGKDSDLIVTDIQYITLDPKVQGLRISMNDL